MNRTLVSASRYLCLAALLVSLSGFTADVALDQSPTGGIGRPSALPEGWGFEIGNGKRLIRNLNGMYGLRINNAWEVGVAGRFTEIFTSLAEGTPRAILRINVLDSKNCSYCARIDSFNKLVDLFTSRATGWTVIDKSRIGGHDAIQKEGDIGAGRCMLDVRVFKKPGEVASISLDSAPDCTGQSSYQTIRQSLESFEFLPDDRR